jgi:hypothetical protein
MARKHNLTLQNSWLDWNVSHLTVTDNVVDIVVAGATHVLSSFQGEHELILNSWEIVGLQKGTHAHISDHISRFWLWQDLIVAGSTHVVTDADAAVSPVYYITMGAFPDYTRNLPAFKIEGRFNETGRLDSELVRLPGVQMVEGRFGIRSGVSLDRLSESTLKLPEITLEASGLSGVTITMGFNKLPTIVEWIDSDMRFGQNLDAKLPWLEITAAFAGEFFFSVDASLPGVKCEATITVPVGMYLDARLPAFTIDTNHTISRNYQLDVMLPALKIEAYSYGGYGAVLDALLPAVLSEADATADDLLTLDAVLPTVIMAAVGTGIGTDGLPGVMIEETRFDDYVLRYSRTA